MASTIEVFSGDRTSQNCCTVSDCCMTEVVSARQIPRTAINSDDYKYHNGNVEVERAGGNCYTYRYDNRHTPHNDYRHQYRHNDQNWQNWNDNRRCQPNYNDPRYNYRHNDYRYNDYRYNDQRYNDQRYNDYRYNDYRYNDQRYNDYRYNDYRYNDQRYNDYRYNDYRYNDQRYNNYRYNDYRYNDQRYNDYRYNDYRYNDCRYNYNRPGIGEIAAIWGLNIAQNAIMRGGCNNYYYQQPWNQHHYRYNNGWNNYNYHNRYNNYSPGLATAAGVLGIIGAFSNRGGRRCR